MSAGTPRMVPTRARSEGRDGSIAADAGYSLRAVDAVHLATAITMGAKRFITNNRRDFGQEITEVDITYPDALADVALRQLPVREFAARAYESTARYWLG